MTKWCLAVPSSSSGRAESMITCPECGQQAADDAKFCDRCGQGLSASVGHPVVASITPLEPGAILSHGYKIVSLLRQTSRENRYRADRSGDNGTEVFELREHAGPVGPAVIADDPVDGEFAKELKEDPAGPHAKTAELRLAGKALANNGAVAALAASSAEVAHSSVDEDPSPTAASRDNSGRTDGEQGMVEAAAGDATVEHEAAPSETALPERDPREPASYETAEAAGETPPGAAEEGGENQDLGEVFGRVRALSLTLNHPAIQRAVDGFAQNGRVYLSYRAEQMRPLADRAGGLKMEESEALAVGIQLCQAVAFMHRRGLRVNDICPESVASGPDGRIRLTGLDYVSNDNELQSEPVFNDGYTAPEIYRAKHADKRADIFAIGAVLYSCLTGERLEAESWREEAGPIRFYPPHVVTPALEQIVRRALLFDPANRWPTVEAFKTELLKLSSTIRIQAAGLTDVGMVRELNEDSVMMDEYWRDSQIEPANGFLYLIADGMGGAAAGEVASAIAATAIREHVANRFGQIEQGAAGPLVQEALETANRKILDYQAANPESRGMGSTAVAALIVPPEVAIAWVGDSRAYLSQQTGFRQITKDHSLVQRLIEIGQITAEEARHHEHKNVITRSLGARPDGPAGAETAIVRLKRGDRIVLCSDGLTAHVTDGSIAEILRRYHDPYSAARELIVAANAGGGTDNISVVVIFAN
jgi:serine/threonine protein phosphatase PrpC